MQALKDDAQAINALFLWDKDSIIQFFAGLADADGTVTGCGSIRITVAQKERAKKLQLLLRSVGIRASVGLDRRAGVRTNKGPLTRDLYYLQIAECASIKCYRLVPIPHISRTAQTIKDVKELPGSYDVFCFSEPETHKGVFGNVLTYQCDFDKASPAISGHPDTYKWATHRWRGYTLKLLPRFTGIMISVTRELVEKIGYFDAEFGKFGEEHPCPAESPVWMGDYTFKPIGQIKVGDTVIGWKRRQNSAKRYGKEVGAEKCKFFCDTLEKATVQAVVRLERALIEVEFASGRKLRCAPEHTWLNYNGVKEGNPRYIPAEVGKTLVHVIDPQPVQEETTGYKTGYVYGLIAGDGGVANGATVQRTTSSILLERLHRYLRELGIKYTVDEWDYAASKPARRRFTESDRVLTVTRLTSSNSGMNWKPSSVSEWRGWLAGVYDADGYGRSFGQCPIAHAETFDRIVEGLQRFGFECKPQKHQIYLTGGWRELTRFWNLTRPSLSYKLDDSVLVGRFKTKDKVVRITELPGKHPVYCLKTSTGNYVIQGYASKNCDYTIRARFAGGIRCEGQDVNCLDVEHPFLRHQDVQTSMTGAARVNADREAGVIMQRAAFEYRFRHYHRPFRLVYPTMANGYYGGGIPCRQLEQIGYKLVSALSS